MLKLLLLKTGIGDHPSVLAWLGFATVQDNAGRSYTSCGSSNSAAEDEERSTLAAEHPEEGSGDDATDPLRRSVVALACASSDDGQIACEAIGVGSKARFGLYLNR
jgi:hypothetical protein